MKFVAVTTLLLSLTIFAPRAQACSCGPPGPPQEELERHAVVFVGYVQSVETLEHYEGQTAQVRVLGVWKGALNLVVKFFADHMCGYWFTPGEQYVIYAHRVSEPQNDEEYWASLCSRTSLRRHALEDFEELGNPTPLGDLDSTWGAVKALYE